MAISSSLGLHDVTQQNTEKIVIQDWLNGNNFSQTSLGFVPLIVHADVHYSAPDVVKSNQSDIYEDFVSVSQILCRKKRVKRIKKKCRKNLDNLDNLDAIETYEQSKASEKSLDVNDTFDKIFHDGKKMANIIKRTYPGKVKNKMRTNEKVLPIYKDLFVNNSNENESGKVDFSSGSGELWSPKQHKNKTFKKKMSLNRNLMSRKIRKKYFKNNSQHIVEGRRNFKNKTGNENKLISKHNDEISHGESSNKVIDLNTTVLTETIKYKTHCDVNIKDCLVNVGEKDVGFLKCDNSSNNNNKVTSSAVLPSRDLLHNNSIFSNNHCNYKSTGVSQTEFEKLINNKPIVLAKRLDILKFQHQDDKQEKNVEKVVNLSKDISKTRVDVTRKSLLLNNLVQRDKHILSSRSRNSKGKLVNSTTDIFVEHKDSVVDNLQTNPMKEPIKFNKIVFKRKLRKYVENQNNQNHKNMSINESHTENVNSNKSLNISTNLKECLGSESPNSLKKTVLCLPRNNTIDIKSSKPKASEETKINNSAVNETLTKPDGVISFKNQVKENLKIQFDKHKELPEFQYSVGPKGKLKYNKTIVKTQIQTKIQCEDSTSVSESDVIQNNLTSKIKNKRNIKRRVNIKNNNKSITSHLESNIDSELGKVASTTIDIKKSLGDVVKRVPMVLVKPLKICESKSQFIDKTIPLVTRLDILKAGKLHNSNCETKNKECTKTSRKHFKAQEENLNLKVCQARQEKGVLVTPVKVSVLTSPGWSRLEKTKKDFNTAQKARLNILTTGSKLLRSISRLNKFNSTLGSSCQDACQHIERKSPVLKSKRAVKKLFYKDKKGSQLIIDVNSQRNGSEIQEKAIENVNDFNEIKKHTPVKNVVALQCSVQGENVSILKRKSTDMIPNSNIKKQVKKLEISYKRRKTTGRCERKKPDYSTLIQIGNLQKTSLGSSEEKQNISMPLTTMTVNPVVDVSVQTSPKVSLTYLHLTQNSKEWKGNKSPEKCTSPDVADSELLFYDSDRLIPTVDVCDISDKTKDSDIIMPTCKTALNLQDKNVSFDVIDDNCNTNETYFDGPTDHNNVSSINNINYFKQINSNLDNLNRHFLDGSETTEKEHTIVSRDLFSNESVNLLSERIINTPNSCLNKSCKSNIFCDRIPFKELNSVGQLSFDLSKINNYSDSILKNKYILNSGQLDKISFTFRKNLNQCDELPRLDASQQKSSKLDLNQMNEIETVEELYFLCSSSSGSPVNNKYKNISKSLDNDMESPLKSSDFVSGTPDAYGTKNSLNTMENVFRSIQTLDSRVNNESIISLSTVNGSPVNNKYKNISKLLDNDMESPLKSSDFVSGTPDAYGTKNSLNTMENVFRSIQTLDSHVNNESIISLSTVNGSPVNNKYKNISKLLDNDMESPLKSSDFLMDTPVAYGSKNSLSTVENISRSIQTLDSCVNNESLFSMSTVKLDSLTNTSLEGDLDYDVIVSRLCSDTSSNQNISLLKNTVENLKYTVNCICPINEEKKTSIDFFENVTSGSIQLMNELTNKVTSSNKKGTTWSQIHQTDNVPGTSLTELTNSINTTLLTEVLDTQQQQHLGEECVQLEAQIQALENELNRKIHYL